MESIAAANRGLMAVCPVHSAMVVSPTSKRVNLVLSAHKAFISGTALRTSTLSTPFEDQSHVQFYLNLRCSRKEKKKHGSNAYSRYNMGGMYEDDKERMIRKPKMGSSSSSSSSESSDSDYDWWDRRGTTTIRPDGTRVFKFYNDAAEPRKFDKSRENSETRKFDNLRKDSERLARTKFLKSSIRNTSELKMESPVGETIEKIRKAFNLPPTPPAPPMIDFEPTVEDIRRDLFSFTGTKPATAHVKVCTGGKCMKAGASEVLNSFQVAGGPDVTASPCKCMKNCQAAVSISIEDRDGRSHAYTRVGLNDVDVLLQKHCSF